MIPTSFLKLLWGAVVLGALALMLRGLWAGLYFEPTGEAVAEARSGQVMVLVACGLLVLAALYAVQGAAWPLWVGAGLLAPVVLCGGLTWFASGTLLPQLAVLVAYPSALTSAVGGLLARSGRPANNRPSQAAGSREMDVLRLTLVALLLLGLLGCREEAKDRAVLAELAALPIAAVPDDGTELLRAEVPGAARTRPRSQAPPRSI